MADEVEKTEGFFEKNKYGLSFIVVGILLVGLGVLGYKFFNLFSNQPKVEILGDAEMGSENCEAGNESGDGKCEIRKITVEVAGEIQKPGVYELVFGSRTNDLLITGGGLSANADRDWVEKNINLAQKLADGVKIYIPSIKEISSGSSSSSDPSFPSKININIASEKELDSLWGVGEVTIKKIIEGRPYQKPEDLLNKKIIKSNVWEKIKDTVTVY